MAPLTISLLLLAGQKTTRVDLDVLVDNQKIGTAQAVEREMADGSSRTILSMTIEARGTKLTMETVSNYDKAGRPISVLDKRILPTGEESSRRTYGRNSVQFVHYRAGKKVESKQIFIPKGVSTINPSRTWFKETMPKVGASATCWRVSPKGEGKRVHMVYKGPEKVRVGSTTYEAFRLDVRGEGSMWLEKGAVPVKMEMRQGQLTITLLRRPAK